MSLFGLRLFHTNQMDFFINLFWDVLDQQSNKYYENNNEEFQQEKRGNLMEDSVLKVHISTALSKCQLPQFYRVI